MTHRAATATSFHTDAHAATRLFQLWARRTQGNGSVDRLSRAEWATTVNGTMRREGFYRESGSKIPTKSERGVLTGGVAGRQLC